MVTKNLLGLIAAALALYPTLATAAAADVPPDAVYNMVVCGGTSARVVAAIQTQKMGRSAISCVRTSIWAACPAAGWAGPTPATRR